MCVCLKIAVCSVVADDGVVLNGDTNGDASEDDKPKKCDIILITGKKENCEQAKEALEVSTSAINQACDLSGFFLFLVFYLFIYFIFFLNLFAYKFSQKKRSRHQGKKEVPCIVPKPLVSCLWGCGESVNPPKLNIQEVQGALSSRPQGDPGPATHFSGFVTSHPWLL